MTQYRRNPTLGARHSLDWWKKKVSTRWTRVVHISKIHEDLIKDLYSLGQIHLTEIQKLLEEFEDDQMQFAIELETYEKERVQSDKGDKEEDET